MQKNYSPRKSEPENIKEIMKDRNLRIIGADPFTKKGYAKVPIVILQSKKINDIEKLVYSVLLNYCWYKDFCFPGQEKLGKELGKSRMSISTAIKNLQKAGYLKITRRGLGKTNSYTLIVDGAPCPTISIAPDFITTEAIIGVSYSQPLHQVSPFFMPE